MNPHLALEKVNEIAQPGSRIIDVGAGQGRPHSKWFQGKGHNVDSCDFFNGSTYQGDFNTVDIPHDTYDVVWGSHVLEHQLNVNAFLKKCYDICKVGGIIAITVPPAKDEIVGGHVTLWNPGIVIYNLVLAGFDCSNAHIKRYEYNQSVIAYKNPFKLPKLVYDRGDLDTLKPWLPKGLTYKRFGQFEGMIQEHNW